MPLEDRVDRLEQVVSEKLVTKEVNELALGRISDSIINAVARLELQIMQLVNEMHDVRESLSEDIKEMKQATESTKANRRAFALVAAGACLSFVANVAIVLVNSAKA